MNSQETLQKIASEIAEAVNQYNPVMDISSRDSFSTAAAFLSNYVPSIALSGNEQTDRVVDDYLGKVISSFRYLSSSMMKRDPYLRDIHFSDCTAGRYQLRNVSYEKGEILQYDFPLIDGSSYIPRLGCFTEKVCFPTVYEGTMPWMSVIPSEINTMREPAEKAHGKVLTLGLGLGYYQYLCLLNSNVEEVTVAEISEDVIELFKKNILPQFSADKQARIHIIHTDAYAYMKQISQKDYDFVFADLWEGEKDGREGFRRLEKEKKRLPGMEFSYWIEKYIQ